MDNDYWKGMPSGNGDIDMFEARLQLLTNLKPAPSGFDDQSSLWRLWRAICFGVEDRPRYIQLSGVAFTLPGLIFIRRAASQWRMKIWRKNRDHPYGIWTDQIANHAQTIWLERAFTLLSESATHQQAS